MYLDTRAWILPFRLRNNAWLMGVKHVLSFFATGRFGPKLALQLYLTAHRELKKTFKIYLRSQVPQNQVVVCSICHNLVAMLLQLLSKCLGIGLDLCEQANQDCVEILEQICASRFTNKTNNSVQPCFAPGQSAWNPNLLMHREQCLQPIVVIWVMSVCKAMYIIFCDASKSNYQTTACKPWTVSICECFQLNLDNSSCSQDILGPMIICVKIQTSCFRQPIGWKYLRIGLSQRTESFVSWLQKK